ncbi:hypothetical protein V1Y59_00345 [Gordonia sp. PKS22-38]|uniref:Mce-associated membrane protein n=1 Tax=Gordonia prachuapensis TaxID=3115651 RepID=A0ABU7MMF8_9ACTN|nr:hypothetical protein [Gordonia sp. PKS22-38]
MSDRRPMNDRGSQVISTRRAVVVACVLAVTLLVVSGALVAQGRQRADDSATERTRTELRRDAGEIVAQVFSVDVSSWRADRDRARALIGGEFADRYATELTRPPADGVRSVIWRPEVVGVVDAEPDRGQTLIRTSVTTQGSDADESTTERRSITAQFDRLGGQWVLTAVEVL